MFTLTAIDLIRLDSDHAAQNYMVHARSAERLARTAFTARITIVTLLAIAMGVDVLGLLIPMRAYQIAAAAAAAIALVGFAVYAVLGLESRVAAHRALAHRLWLVAERYRSLLAEVTDGTVDAGALVRRREELVHDLHAIYERGFGADQPAHETARLPALPSDRAA